LELTNKDNRLIDAYVEILNPEGGHACISQEKYFRLTKNIGIEIAFFLYQRMKKSLRNLIIYSLNSHCQMGNSEA
jgi:hypothetical protein